MKIKRYSGAGTIEKITEHSTQTKELRIFELAKSLGDYIPQEKAEAFREAWVMNRTQIKQLTNRYAFPQFTEIALFGDAWQARSVAADVLTSQHEFLLYDDTFACYWLEDGEAFGYELYDRRFADVQKQLFDLAWHQGIELKSHDGSYHSGFYTPYGMKTNTGVPVIVYPCYGLEKVLPREAGAIENYINTVFKKNQTLLSHDLVYGIAIVWEQHGKPMLDLWQYSQLESWGSGPLVDVTVFCEHEPEQGTGVGAGDGLVVLGEEERLRRASPTLEHYVFGDISPHLPSHFLVHGDFVPKPKKGQ